MKDDIKTLLRATMKRVRVPSEGPYRETAIEFLNDVFVTSSSGYWGNYVGRKVIPFKYGVVLPKEWKGSMILSFVDKSSLISRFEMLSGVKLATGAAQLLQLGTSLLYALDI
jgi:hypothetical protein